MLKKITINSFENLKKKRAFEKTKTVEIRASNGSGVHFSLRKPNNDHFPKCSTRA